ncbi:MAG: SEC-C domain-containing protein [Desulfobacterales bacterium]|nr:SEC-C domain-containing protein [Desulfobacterales bacterium]
MCRKSKKIGRNDPCPCGSGKKYKKCCMLKKKAASPESVHYRRLSKAYDRLFDRLTDHAERIFGEDAIKCALDEFWGWPESDEEGPDPEAFERQMPLFLAWFVFNWEYDEFDEDYALDGPPERTVAELYVEEKGDRVDPLERALIESTNRIPYSFWEALEVEPGHRIRLKDVFTGEEITVEERSGSEYLKPADIVFGRAVLVDGVGMFMGLSAFIISPSHKPELINVRKNIKRRRKKVTADDLVDLEAEIREYFLDLDRHLHSPPKLVNTDGDPLEFHKVVFEIDSPEEAVDNLASLCVTDSADGIRKDAETGPDGRIRGAEIAWNRWGHKGSPELPNTLLGRIVIDETRLTAEVNSANRAKKVREEIERRMGKGARFKMDRIEDLDAAMARQTAEGGSALAEHEELMEYPEVREKMAEMMNKHWEQWVDMPVPALGNKTPRKAVKTVDGREAVEGLLAGALRRGTGDDFMEKLTREGVRRARKLLGLADSESRNE